MPKCRNSLLPPSPGRCCLPKHATCEGCVAFLLPPLAPLFSAQLLFPLFPGFPRLHATRKPAHPPSHRRARPISAQQGLTVGRDSAAPPAPAACASLNNVLCRYLPKIIGTWHHVCGGRWTLVLCTYLGTKAIHGQGQQRGYRCTSVAVFLRYPGTL